MADADKPPLTHFDDAGRARMVDVSAKPETARMALAEGYVSMAPETLEIVRTRSAKKGDAAALAELAGIMGAKRTADLIPLCHPLPLTGVTVEADLDAAKSRVRITARAKTTGPTGVEMEALTAVCVACLTLYDMLKAADKTMTIEDIRLLQKTGGQSGDISHTEQTS